MSFWKTLAELGGEIVQNAMKEQSRKMRNGKKNPATGRIEYETIGGKTYRQWESGWRYAGRLDNLDLSRYSHSVGLYKAEMNGEVMYVGRAIEYSNGGIRKRLSDYTRDSDSARKHTSGRMMHANASDLSIYILVVGSDASAAEATRKLERYFIAKYSPKWNKQFII